MKTMDRHLVSFNGQDYDLHDRDQRIEFGMAKWEQKIHGLASRYRNAVCGYDDFVQEAHLIIIKAADAWDPERGEFDTFLYECIKNGLIDVSTNSRYAVSVPSGSVKRTKGFRTSRLHEDIPDDSGDPFEQIDILDTIENFDDKRIATMYFVEKLTLQEISEQIGISVSAVHRKVSNMRDCLQKKLTC